MAASSLGEAQPRPSSLPLSRGPLLPGTYAWLSTVLLPVYALNGAWAAQSLAWSSGAALLVGSFPSRFVSLRPWGLGTFIGGCLGTWVLLADQLRSAPIDSIQAAMGGLGWLLFAVSVQGPAVAAQPTRSFALPAERRRARTFPPALNGLFVLLVLLGLVPLFLAWRVSRPAHAVLAQLVAGAATLAALFLGAAAVDSLALRRGHAMRWAVVWPTLAMLVLLLVVGLVLKLF